VQAARRAVEQVGARELPALFFTAVERRALASFGLGERCVRAPARGSDHEP
jgi:hypothetical protein